MVADNRELPSMGIVWELEVDPLKDVKDPKARERKVTVVAGANQWNPAVTAPVVTESHTKVLNRWGIRSKILESVFFVSLA